MVNRHINIYVGDNRKWLADVTVEGKTETVLLDDLLPTLSIETINQIMDQIAAEFRGESE